MSTKAPRVVTPVGTLVFPYLTKTDTKFYALGEYRTRIAFDPKSPEWAAFIEKVTPIRDALIAAEIAKDKKLKTYTVKPVGEPEFDKDQNPTGRNIFGASQRAVVESEAKGRLEFSIVIVDAKKQPWPKSGAAIYGGTKAKLSIDLRAAVSKTAKTIGLGFRLVGVQVLDLVTGGNGATAESAGFGEEDGFAVPASAPAGEAGEGGESEQF